MTVKPSHPVQPVFGLNTFLPETVNPCVCLDLLVIQNLFETHRHCLSESQRLALTDMAARLCAQLGVAFDPAIVEPGWDTENSILSELIK